MFKYQTQVYGVCEEEAAYGETKCAAFWCYLPPVTRLWGVLTSVVLCGVGVDITVHHHNIGIYYIVGAAVVFFLEITWAITLFLEVCVRNDCSTLWRCWKVILWINLWKKSILYSAFALLLFLRPHRLWLSIVAGLQLMLLATLHLLLTIRRRYCVKDSPCLLPNHSQSPSQEDLNDRFDDITGLLDDSLPGPLVLDHLSDLEQDGLLEM